MGKCLAVRTHETYVLGILLAGWVTGAGVSGELGVLCLPSAGSSPRPYPGSGTWETRGPAETACPVHGCASLWIGMKPGRKSGTQNHR